MLVKNEYFFNIVESKPGMAQVEKSFTQKQKFLGSIPTRLSYWIHRTHIDFIKKKKLAFLT